MKRVFELTYKYIILATPVILFSLFSSIYVILSAHKAGITQIIFMLVILFLMGTAFTAGWGNMVKLASLDHNSQEPNSIINAFTAGVGEYFLPSCGMIICAFIFNLLFFICAFTIGVHFIGDVGISNSALSKAISNQAALKMFLTGLSSAQLIKNNMWNLLLLFTIMLTSFLLILYFPAVFFSTKNPIKALFMSIRYIFSKNFFKTIGIYLIIFVTNFIISILSAIFANNIVMNFLITLLNFYFICTVAVGLFYYYNNVIIPKSGQIIDTKV